MVVGDGDAEKCSSVMANVKCDKKFVFMVSYPMPRSEPKRFATFHMIVCFISWNVRWWVKSKLQEVGSKSVFGSSMVYNEISLALFEQYLSDAMAEGKSVAAPEPCVVGVGLDKDQEASNTQKVGNRTLLCCNELSRCMILRVSHARVLVHPSMDVPRKNTCDHVQLSGPLQGSHQQFSVEIL